MVAKGFLIPLANGNHYMSVSFRVPSAMCSGAADPSLTLGNQLVLNQGALNYPLPTTDKEALAAGWTKGSCFSTMGTHWFRDISTGTNMTCMNTSCSRERTSVCRTSHVLGCGQPGPRDAHVQ